MQRAILGQFRKVRERTVAVYSRFGRVYGNYYYYYLKFIMYVLFIKSIYIYNVTCALYRAYAK